MKLFITADFIAAQTVNNPLTATLMPRLPPLFFSSMIKCSAVFKLMMDGDLEHASYK